jgi:WASH complex subunit strumpellin
VFDAQVSRGSAIVAEIQRLSERMPDVYTAPVGDDKLLTPDFAYFNSVDKLQTLLDDRPSLQARDDALCIMHSALLERVFAVCDSVHGYGAQIQKLIDELNENVPMRDCHLIWVLHVSLHSVDPRI